jgi:hypothetical protein
MARLAIRRTLNSAREIRIIGYGVPAADAGAFHASLTFTLCSISS